MAAPIYLRHRSSLEHETGPHPEAAHRIRVLERELAARDWLGWEMAESPAASLEALRLVHPPGYVEAIRRACAAGADGPVALDADTLVSSGSWEAALHSAGGAVQLVDLLLDGAAPAGMSAHRPPGHHAEPTRAMGFCLFANPAIAARHALDARGLERVLVLDWDVHHGNGTQDILYEDPRALFASIHEAPGYPGTGAASERGTGAGEGFTLNLPVPAGSGDDVWCSLVEHVVVPRARAFAPELVLVSAGYDAHADDPLAGCLVTDDGFRAMARSVRRLGAELSAPIGVLLEGGYDVDALARSVAVTLEEIGAQEPRPALDLPVHPLAGRFSAA
jgi:acetoin utilization deacetylase AcuC-like enzyme